MNFDGMTLANVESLGEIVVAKLKEAKHAQVEAIATGTAFLLRAQELPDVGQPPVYFAIVELLKAA